MSLPRYPKYKDSGLPWLGGVPGHWVVERLKQRCEVSPSNVDKKLYDGEAPVRLCNYTDVYYNERITADMDLMAATASAEQIARFTLRAGDTIITKDSETADDIAVAAFVPIDLPGVVCGYHLAVVRPSSGTNGAFVKRLFDSNYVKSCVATLANGLTRVGLGQYELDNLPLPWPPPAEQAAIVTFLDRQTAKIDGLMGEQRRLIELLDEKRQSAVAEAVTKGLDLRVSMKPSGIQWLGEVPAHWSLPPLYTRFGQVLGKMLDQGRQTGHHPVPYLRNVDVRWDHINLDNLPTMDIAPNERERFTIRDGDLLMVEGRELGRCAIWHGDSGQIGFQKALHRLRVLDETEHMRFFYYLMIYANRAGAFVADQSPSEIPHLTGEELRRHRFPKPPYGEQVQIAEHLDTVTRLIGHLIAEAEHAITLLQERRTALISAAVTGEIDVRNLA